MPAKNISFNTPNHAKFNELMKATGKPTRQAAIADVLRHASKNAYLSLDNSRLYSLVGDESNSRIEYRNKNKLLRENITLYRTALVVLAFVAVTGWIL